MRAQAAYSLAYVQYGPRDQWAAAVRATEIATEAYKSADDETGIHNASTLRSAAEIELAGAMNAGTQRAEQRALYAGADRRLADAAEYFGSHALPVRAQYATNMRAVLAVSTTDYATGGNTARALGRNGARQWRRRRRGKVTRQSRGRTQFSRVRCAGRDGI